VRTGAPPPPPTPPGGRARRRNGAGSRRREHQGANEDQNARYPPVAQDAGVQGSSSSRRS
jgi:hypothetical protein